MIRRIRNERGQIIIAAPFIILFLVAGVFFMINIGTMTEQKIRVQVATDATARDAAYMQALALESITLLNTSMIAADGIWLVADAYLAKSIAEGVTCASDPILNFEECIEAVEDFEKYEKYLKRAKKLRDTTKDAMKAFIYAAAAAAEGNALGYEFAENVNESTCTISSGCFSTLFYTTIKIKAISDSLLHEAVMGDVMILDGDPGVKVLGNKASRDGFASSFFGNFKFPDYASTASAEPYCTEGSDDDCSSGYDCPCAVNYDNTTTLWRARLKKTL